MKHIITILPALIIALGLCGAAWIYANAQPRYAAAGILKDGGPIVVNLQNGEMHAMSERAKLMARLYP